MRKKPLWVDTVSNNYKDNCESYEEEEDIDGVVYMDEAEGEVVLSEDETTTVVDTGDEESLLLKSSSKVTIEQVPTKFSDVSDNKVTFSDFYHDTRSFLDKANSTKFILLVFLMVTIPILLITEYISSDIYKDMVIIISLCYLGVDVYEKKSLVKR